MHSTLTLLASLLLAPLPAVYAGRTLPEVPLFATLGDGSISVTAGGAAAQTFKPVFTVLYRGDDPKPADAHVVLGNSVCSWALTGATTRTANVFKAAEGVTLTATGAKRVNGEVRWEFAPQAGFTLEASLLAQPNDELPQLRFELVAKRPGWYSVGYVGAPEYPFDKVASLFQPRIWQERRLPADCYLTDESECSLPAALVESGGVTVGLIADPADVPFRLPTRDNARFGVMVRNAAQNVQPMLFAPVLGRSGSKLDAGGRIAFRLRLSARAGDCYESFHHLAQKLYGVRDCRENTYASLNQTLANMVAFGMNDPAVGWLAEYKAFDYATDEAHTVKLVSALHPLSIALATDDEDVFLRRVRPMTEFMLSREKYLFAIKPGTQAQNPSHRMDGPTGEVFEWSSLLKMSQDRTPAFLNSAKARFNNPRALNLDSVHHDDVWVQCLAMYYATGEKTYLDEARAKADDYLSRRLATPSASFEDFVRSAQFYTDVAPRWMQLLELYEATGEKKYLDAADRGARLFAMVCWMFPAVPEGDVTLPTVDTKNWPTGQSTTPAWRVSQIGLTPEATTTSSINSAILLAHHAPYLLRLAQLTGDDFYRTIARWAVIGRYANYPGYSYNSIVGFTADYESPEYPVNGTVRHDEAWKNRNYPTAGPMRFWRTNHLFFNHVWSHIALTLDYLVSDAYASSHGKIDFPSRYAQGYVYLQTKVYGDRPGRFYEDEGVRLYLPANLIETDNVQMNHVAGYGNGKLYVALLNQADRPGDVTVRFNPKLSGLEAGRSYKARLWRENRPAAPLTIEGATVNVPVAPRGITALAIEGAHVHAPFQEKVFDKAARPLGPDSCKSIDSLLGKVHGMMLSFGRELTNAYVWLAASDKDLSEATLHYRVADGEWQAAVDKVYPFEFSVPLADKDAVWEFWVEGRKADGGQARASAVTLRR